MTRRVFGGAWLAIGLSCAAACSKPGAEAKPVPSATRSPGSLPATASAPPGPSRALPSKPGCRALTVSGQVTLDGKPLLASNLLDGEHWVTLEAGAAVALRHTLTSREFRLIGPARVLPCRGGAEQLLLAEGRLSTSANLGVRPGAEVLIATPAGTVRYGDAALDVEFGAPGLRVRVKQGEAWVEPESRGKPRFENPVKSGGQASLKASGWTPGSLVAACEAAARTAQASAKSVLDTGSLAAGAAAGSSLGARAALHVRERQKARMSCAMAAAAVDAGGDPSEKQRLSASVVHADELWQSVPHAGSSQGN